MIQMLPDILLPYSAENPTEFIQIKYPAFYRELLSFVEGFLVGTFSDDFIAGSVDLSNSFITLGKDKLKEGYFSENVNRSNLLKESRKKRQIVISEPKQFLQMLDDFMVKPWTFLSDQVQQHYPTDAVDTIFYQHQYLNMDPIFNFQLNELHRILNIPEHEIGQFYLYIEKLIEDLPQLFSLVGSSASQFQYDLTNYIAYNYPSLNFIRDL